MEKRYYVNPLAESVCSSVSVVILIVSFICAIIGLVAGIASGTILIGILAAIGFIILGLVSWASLKVFINISRSLYNINDALCQGITPDGKILSEEPSNTTDTGSFKVGQLVVIKADESQFRITAVNGNEVFSEKLGKKFKADEIEDFDIYWSKKK